VTQLRNIADFVQRELDNFRPVLDAVPIPVYVTDTRGVITYYNPAAAAFWGRHPVTGKDEWWKGWNILRRDGTRMPRDEYAMAVTLREKRATQGVSAVCERPDGTRIPFSPFPTPLFDAQGGFTGAVSQLVDTTELERAQAEIERQNAELTILLEKTREVALLKSHLAAIVEGSDDAVISKNFFGIITSWNPAAERIYGYTAQEAIGKHISIVVPFDHQDEEYDIIDRLRRGERVDHFQTVRRTKTGKLVNVSITVSPVRDADGKVIGASKVARLLPD
jgi:PAS domain S-box-containing protein